MKPDPRLLALQNIEVWEPVPHTPYEASNLGRLRNPKTGNLVGTCLLKNGYLSLPGILSHRAILSAFDGPQPPRVVARHLDDNRSNNRLTNLAWGTRTQNAADTAAAGRLRSRSGAVSVLDVAKADSVFALLAERKITQREAASTLNRSGAWVSVELRKRTEGVTSERSRAWSVEAARLLCEQGTEVWVPAVGAFGREVSNLGRVRNRKTKKIQSVCVEKRSGYVKTLDGPLLHRVVLSSFDDPPFDGALIRHTPDPDRTNNALTNLQWGTYKDNGEDTRKDGRTLIGERHPRATMTDAKVEEGLRLYAENGWTSAQLSDFLNDVGQGNASDIVNGKVWGHVPCPPTVAAHRRQRAAKEATPPPPLCAFEGLLAHVRDRTAEVMTRTFRLLSDDHDLLSRESLILATREVGRERIEAELLPAVATFFRTHVAVWGWFYPTCAETLADTLAALRAAPLTESLSASARLGADFLRTAMPSFWNVSGGPVVSFGDDAALRGVLRYRLGLNNSKDYTYTLSTGEEVSTRETFDINIKNVRRGFVVQRKAASFFKPAVAQSVYRRWVTVPEPVVWDCSGGFGGRLLGFAAAFPGGVYYACEPASQTHHDLSALGVALVEGGHLLHAEVLKQGSETVSFAPETLDFVFTSPPYFDLERYFDEPGQCWRDYPTEALWITHYLVPTMHTAFTGLRKGCAAVFNVDSLRRDIFVAAAEQVGFVLVEEDNLALGTDHFARKRGALEKRSEPVLVFRKP